MLLAVEDSLDSVVDTTEVRRLDLNHVSSLALREGDDILERVAPLVSDDLALRALGIK